MRYKNEEKARLRSINYELLDSKHNRETAIIYRTIDFGALRDTQPINTLKLEIKSISPHNLTSWSIL